MQLHNLIEPHCKPIRKPHMGLRDTSSSILTKSDKSHFEPKVSNDFFSYLAQLMAFSIFAKITHKNEGVLFIINQG